MFSHMILFAAASCLVPAAITAAPAVPAAQSPNVTAHAALFKLFADSDEAYLTRNPIAGIYRGDLRHADRLADTSGIAWQDAERSAARAELAQLARIDRTALGPVDRIAHDVFRYGREEVLKSLTPEMLALTAVRPIDHFTGFQVDYPAFSSGQGSAPFNTLLDYENALKRHRLYAAMFDNWIVAFRRGMASGVVQPRLVVRNLIEQLESQIAEGVEGSTFYGPVRKFPAGIAPADQQRLKAEYATIVRHVLIPAETRLRDFLRDEYLPRAREGIGLVSMKGGDILYRAAIEAHTTLPLSAGEVHRLGLREVARITLEMEETRRRVDYKGSLPQFFEYLRTDPRFQPKSANELRDAYYAIGQRVDRTVGTLFSRMPKARLEIRAVEPYREKTAAGGSYQQGTPDGAQPGIFYFNTYDLPSRTTPGIETLYLHEAIPGHHFQISLAQENLALPNFMRFGGNTAYVEGWALYAESLWRELGVETDPYQRFGGLNDEMLRAMRLVVDSGIHAKGWSRDKAIQYMLDHSSMGRTDATAEVDRYIAWPGQALAYKVGAIKIRELRTKAEKALGAKFDVRAFHDEVLNSGSLPLTILEAKIDSWIVETKRS
jgi:uncharacterized protein (DUF885 family)